jgi:hypothetical protein
MQGRPVAPWGRGGAVVLGQTAHGPRGWPAGGGSGARCRERENEKSSSKSRTPRAARLAAAFPKSRDDDWDVPLLTARLAG